MPTDIKPSSWLSVLPPLVTVPKRNRISPAVKPELSSTKSMTSPTFSHLLKRLTPSTLSKSNLEPVIQQQIYMKSPLVVASGELAGSVVIQQDGDLQQLSNLKLTLVGIEEVMDSHKAHIKNFEFLNLVILNISNLEEYAASNKITVPFLASVPFELGGTYIDKKGSIQYYLYSILSKKSCEPHITKKPVIVYSNMVLRSLKDASTLYTPVLQSNKQVWKTDEGHVLIDLTMPRTVWMSGAPIYVTVKIHNATLKETVVDMKLELVRKQSTYSINANDQSIIPVTSSCEIIAQSSLTTWWNPLEPSQKDRVTLTIEAPSNQVTVRNQKLIDVSYFIRMSITSAQNMTEMVAELPVMLVHPISMDPPPGNYAKSAATSTHKPVANEYHLLLQDTFQKQQQAARILQPSASLRSLGSASYKSCSSSKASSQLQPTIKRLESVRKSLSTWISRRMSVSSSINHIQKLEISSPLVMSSPSSSESFSDSVKSSVSTKEDQDIINFIANDSSMERMSVMKFGQIKGPKRFGQQPGCLGDAGLDIRNCFNVATATEAIQSYAAEKVEIPDDDEWFVGHQDPCQKLKVGNVPDRRKEDGLSKEILQLDSSVISVLSTLDTQEDQASVSCSNVAIQHKRMLASSRHLKNVQRKSVQVSKDGRPMLALTNFSAA